MTKSLLPGCPKFDLGPDIQNIEYQNMSRKAIPSKLTVVTNPSNANLGMCKSDPLSLVCISCQKNSFEASEVMSF